jgi:hypothetical protein
VGLFSADLVGVGGGEGGGGDGLLLEAVNSTISWEKWGDKQQEQMEGVKNGMNGGKYGWIGLEGGRGGGEWLVMMTGNGDIGDWRRAATAISIPSRPFPSSTYSFHSAD